MYLIGSGGGKQRGGDLKKWDPTDEEKQESEEDWAEDY